MKDQEELRRAFGRHGDLRRRKMVGLILVLLGVFWLLSALGIITTEVTNLIWPIIVIAIGLGIIIRPTSWHRKDKGYTTINDEKKNEDK